MLIFFVNKSYENNVLQTFLDKTIELFPVKRQESVAAIIVAYRDKHKLADSAAAIMDRPSDSIVFRLQEKYVKPKTTVAAGVDKTAAAPEPPPILVQPLSQWYEEITIGELNKESNTSLNIKYMCNMLQSNVWDLAFACLDKRHDSLSM